MILLFLWEPKEKCNKKKGFSFLSFLRRKERTKQERKVAGCAFFAEKGGCFRNKINLLLRSFKQYFVLIGNALLFLFAKNARPGGAEILGFYGEGANALRCLLGGCFSGCLLRKDALGGAQMHFAVCECVLAKTLCSLLQMCFALCGCLLRKGAFILFSFLFRFRWCFLCRLRIL